MGNKAAYRWERRAKRSHRSYKDRKSLFAFQLILLILIFFVYAVGARIIGMIAIITSHCIEATAHFGAFYDGPTTFERLRSVTFIAMMFWLLVTLNFWRALKGWLPIAFHLALLGGLFVAQAIFFHMTLDGNQQPDGYLNVNTPIVSVVDGKPVYNPHIRRLPEYESWISGQNIPPESLSRELENQQCVWLDDNIISAGYMHRVDEYADMTMQERYNWSHSSWAPSWNDIPKIDLLRQSMNFLKTNVSQFDRIQQKQSYRYLTDDERQRYIAKQTCLVSNYDPERYTQCSYTRYVDWPRYEREITSKYMDGWEEEREKRYRARERELGPR